MKFTKQFFLLLGVLFCSTVAQSQISSEVYEKLLEGSEKRVESVAMVANIALIAIPLLFAITGAVGTILYRNTLKAVKMEIKDEIKEAYKKSIQDSLHMSIEEVSATLEMAKRELRIKGSFIGVYSDNENGAYKTLRQYENRFKQVRRFFDEDSNLIIPDLWIVDIERHDEKKQDEILSRIIRITTSTCPILFYTKQQLTPLRKDEIGKLIGDRLWTLVNTEFTLISQSFVASNFTRGG
jgi:hypothetical protein